MLYKYSPGSISYGNIAEHKIADNMEAQLKLHDENWQLTALQRQMLLGPHTAGNRPSHAELLDVQAGRPKL